MNPYLVWILILVVGTAVLDVVADLLNLGRLSPTVPKEFEGVYDAAKYAEAMRYQRDRVRFDVLVRSGGMLVGLGFLLAGGFGWADRVARQAGGGSEIPTGLVFAAVLGALRMITQLPVSAWDTFVLEERYGFNRTSPRTFVVDTLKGILLSALLGAPVFAGLIWFFERAGEHGWLWAWLALTAFQLFVVFLAPVVILPLFNKFDPLAPGELRAAIEDYARAQKFALAGIFTMDGSKRSTRANAFFTGFGRFRRIVLFDTLIARQSVPELVAVLAHEIGHFKRGHIVQTLVLSILGAGGVLFLFSLFVPGSPLLFEAFRVESVSVYASLVFVAFLLSPVLRLFSIPTQALSRRFEFEADEFAARTFGHPESLASALKKLSVDNFSHLTPHPLKVLLDYSHPPVLARITRLSARAP